MSDFFDVDRFGRLLRAHWAENWRGYAWFAAFLVMLDLILVAICFGKALGGSFVEFQFSGQKFWYTAGLFASASVFAGRYFKFLIDPGAGLIALMRPASVFEKWLMAFLIISVLYPLAYSILYVVMNYPFVQLAKRMYVETASYRSSKPDFRVYIPFLSKEMITDKAIPTILWLVPAFWYIWLSTAQALIAGGTVYFKRSPILRTVLSLFLLFVIFISIGGAPQTSALALNGEMYYSKAEYILSHVLWLGLPVILWTVLFFHIKERELA